MDNIPEQDQESKHSKEQLVSTKPSSKLRFVIGWLIVNLIAWMIGIYSLSERRWMDHLEVTGIWQLPDAIGQLLVMISIPLGLGMGILQSTSLGRWRIPKIPWIVVTSLGWILPAYLFSRFRWYLLFNDPMGLDFVDYLEFLWILYPLALLYLGAEIGVLQTLVMGKSMTKPWLWILVNALGLLIFGWLVNGILRIAIAPRFMDIETLLKRGDPLVPPYLVWPAIATVIPFVAILFIALPTGLILWKFGRQQSE